MMDEFADSRKEKIAIYALITFVIIVTMAIGLAVIAKAFQLSITELEVKEAELNESSSHTLQIPYNEDGISSVEGSKRKIFDTGELSHLNLSLD